VRSWRWLAGALLIVGIGVEALRAEPPLPAPVERGGYVVLAVDFHVHSFLGDGALPPWLLIDEARRRGLDAIAITNHNRTWPARLGRWLTRDADAPIVLVGEEVTSRAFHITAIGVEQPVDWRHAAADAIEAIHAQGGIAIAAHPALKFWPSYDDRALRELDGTERSHASIFHERRTDRQFAIFFNDARSVNPTVAAIGASDFHVVGYPGICRTYVFARERSARGILEAVRAGRTVVYDKHGQLRGDPALFALMPADSRTELRTAPRPGLGGVAVWLGLLGLVLLGGGRRRSRGPSVSDA
jgi:predicted metal-dependent phosphoesterase TrpH